MTSHRFWLPAFVGALLGNIAPAFAAVSADQAAALKTTLTPLGGERAGNKEGTIPRWEGGWIANQAIKDTLLHDKPQLQITAKNVGEHAAKLSEGAKALLKKYPDTFRLDVYPSRRTAAAPAWAYDNTFKNATRASTTAGGLSIKGAYGGIPFPIPKDGHEVMWNHTLHVFPESIKYTFRNVVGAADGTRTVAAESILDAQFPYYMKDGSAEAWNGDYILSRQNQVAPPFKAGESLVIRDSIDVATPRQAWQYLVGQRRVRRAPTVGYDTPDFVSSGVNYFDEVFGFFGALDRYEWKLIGKQDMYVPYNNNAFVAAKSDEVFGRHHLNPDRLRWELHRVWVVEATVANGKRHAVPKRRYYLDEDSWIVMLVDGYDASGKLWRASHAISFVMPEVPAVWAGPTMIYNLQAGTWAMTNSLNDFAIKVLPRRSDAYFTGDALGAEGLR